ncbi:MAG: response regulator [Pseudobdellovibrio sp.]
MAVQIDNEFLEAFKVEALELLVSAESDLLKVEAGQDLKEVYDSVFRALHSVKGGASMFELTKIQEQLHTAETNFSGFKGKSDIGADDLKMLLDVIGNSISFFEGKEIVENVIVAKPAPAVELKKVVATTVAQKPSLGSQQLIAVCVDDEIGILEILVEALEDIGMKVYSFSDPKKALAEIDSIKPDVILSDMMMPGMTGLDLLKGIRKFKSTYPVLFCSGAFDKTILINAINNGAEGVIEKPFDYEFLANVTLNAARKSRLTKMMDQTINLLMYQYTDFDDYLRSTGKDDVRLILEKEMTELISQRSLLRQIKTKIEA